MSQHPVIGELQLLAWEDMAVTWPLIEDPHGHVRCKQCEVSVWRIRDDHGQVYVYDKETITALLVAHLRQCHQDLEEYVYDMAGLEHERRSTDV